MLWIIVVAVFLAILVKIFLFPRDEKFVDEFYGSSVFITGCDSGFGKLLALRLTELGLNVYAGCLNQQNAQQLKSLSATLSGKLTTVIVDLTDDQSITKAREVIENDLPANRRSLWGLVNNAGLLGDICFELLNIDDYRKIFEVNFFGLIKVVNTFRPLLEKQNGRIVTVTSILQRVMIGACPYTASKAAASIYSDALRRSAQRDGILAATIEPGFHPSTGLINYNQWSRGLEQQWAKLSAQAKEALGGEQFKTEQLESLGVMFDEAPFRSWNRTCNVVDAMIHALASPRPKARYVVGWDAWIIALAHPLPPDRIVDVALRWMHNKNSYNFLKFIQKRQ